MSLPVLNAAAAAAAFAAAAATASRTRAVRTDGTAGCRFHWSRGLRAAAAGCRRRQRGQGPGACECGLVADVSFLVYSSIFCFRGFYYKVVY